MNDEPTPLPSPFPVGARLLYVGDRSIRSARSGEPGVFLLRPGIEAQIIDVEPGARGSGRVLQVEEDGFEIVDRTQHGRSVWLNALGQRRAIRADAAHEWTLLWGPFAVGDVVRDGPMFTGIVHAAGGVRFSVLWEDGRLHAYGQDGRAICRFVIGTWDDRAAEDRIFADRRAQLASWRAAARKTTTRGGSSIMKKAKVAKTTSGTANAARPVGAVISSANPCACGHAPEEHGRDPDYPGSTSCRASDCECVAYEEDPVE